MATRRKEKIRKTVMWLAMSAAATAFFFAIAVVNTSFLWGSTFYPVMNGDQILWIPKVIRWGMYVIPYIPVYLAGRNIRFYYKNLVRVLKKRERKC